MQVRKQQLELDMEQQTGSKQEKEYIKAPGHLTVLLSSPLSSRGSRVHHGIPGPLHRELAGGLVTAAPALGLCSP